MNHEAPVVEDRGTGGAEPPAGAFTQDRRELSREAANRFWWPMVAAMVVLTIVVAFAVARSSSGDRGVRGPADQAAPDAPAREKVRPSSER